MFRLLRILFYGWPSREERSAAGEINEILFEQRNKSYGAYQLRQSESWYLLTAMSLTTGIVGSLLLGWIRWAPVKSAKAPAPIEIPRCWFFSPPIPVASVPATPSPNAHPYRKGDGEVKISKFELQPPVPSPLVPHYGEGIGRAQVDERDGWLLPDLPGNDEKIPEIEFRNVHYIEIDTLPYPGEIIIPKIEDEEIPEVKQNLNAERIPDLILDWVMALP